MILFKLIILTTIWCLGMKILTADGMLLEKLGRYAHRKVEEGKLIYDPLIACEFCMPSIHSLFSYFFAFQLGMVSSFSWSLVFIYPLVAMGSSAGCGFTWSAYIALNSWKDKNYAKTEYYDRKIATIYLSKENHN